MKYSVLLLLSLLMSITACAQAGRQTTSQTTSADGDATLATGEVADSYVQVMTGKEFMERFLTEGVTPERPAIVDFNAEWCGPCKRLAPILDELSVKYNGQIDFFSINVDDNRDVAAVLEIQSIPYMVFVPKEGAPRQLVGLYEKEILEGIMCEFLLGIKSDNVSDNGDDAD